MSETILEVQHLGKSFGNNEILKDIDFSVKPKDVTCIIGPSGSGKSTLLRCMNLLETPSCGEIRYHGTNIMDKHVNVPEYRSKVGMVFQNFNLFNNMTVLKNCTVGQEKVLKKSKEEAHRNAMMYLEKVGMAPYINAKPKQLSGGQKQRVAIARALVLNPKILLCDEATSALDPQITKGILALLSKINKELGITIVVVTHQMEVVKEICNKVAFLKNGKMIAAGKPEELFVAPNKDVQEFVGDSVEFLPKDGVNVRLFFNDETASDSAITHLAHDLGINFGICQGKLENFRGTIMGSLVINVTEADKERVTAWLTDRGILWEVLENV